MSNANEEIKIAKHVKRYSLFLVLILAIVFVFVALNPPRKKNMVDISDLDPTTKRILLWNSFFDYKHYGVPLGRAAFSACKVHNCELWDREDSEVQLPHDEFDAVLFHGIGDGINDPAGLKQDIPLVRRPHQRYIFHLEESPLMYPKYYDYENFFNWTATYRRDSDVCAAYFEFRRKGKVIDADNVLDIWREPVFKDKDNFSEIIAKKSKLVAWFVSKPFPPSEREVYVDELSKYIQVDIYGMFRWLSCSRTDAHCDDMLDTTYKFYLSFENSLCVDYVTEKFLRALSHNVIPIVYGGADYELYAPPLSYINVKDFASPRHLAKYLHYLDQHPEEYQKYFWWKEFYEIYYVVVVQYV